MCYLSPNDLENPDREQLMNDGFCPTSRWTIIAEPGDKQLKEDELEVDNIKYRAPTTPREEFERTGNGGGGVKKFDYDVVIERSQFQKEAEVPKLDGSGRLIRDRATGEPLYEKKQISRMDAAQGLLLGEVSS